jgi:hypothetical protein
VAPSKLKRRPPAVQLAKAQMTKPKANKPVAKRKPPTLRETPKVPSKTTAKKASGLAKLFSGDNISETVKTVGNLRGVVKNWVQYLNSADQMLDNLFVTTNSLRETGVLDKLVKQKGKNLNTDDYTNILMALMNSPIGGQMLKGLGGGKGEADDAATDAKPEAAK